MIKKHLKAFALLEVAVALSIIGVIMAWGIPTIMQWQKHQKAAQTIAHKDSIYYALASYVSQTGHFPCPANDMEGVAQPTCSQKPDFIGYIPYKTIGLMKKMAWDGHKKPFTYVIDPVLTQKVFDFTDPKSLGGTSKLSICRDLYNAPKTLRVLDEKDENVYIEKGAKNPDAIGFIIISHGQKKGRFSRVNKSKTETFYDVGLRHDHNDHLFWITRDTFIRQYLGKDTCRDRSIQQKRRNIFTPKN